MKLVKTITLSALVVSTQTFAFGDLLKSDDTKDLMNQVSSSVGQISDSPITELLTSQLDVSNEQASSGGAAMLALAQNSLSSANTSELASMIPGLENMGAASSLLGNIDSLNAVYDVFEKLGLDPSMVAQFAPVIMGYLSDQGASSGLMDSLTGLWK
ncbi:VcgC [Vibrio sp. qd031]|uniref:DUF2780 domain-containing protein n=1 Tax=Vibrio sp. qd031 TaxID=1603038 RepID=UPI000A100329|nr:DUF2780 domain-containing protein [Vibrio sp. qd031]ORT48179.1 VcgC [Vibrio sp. qd031]